jgi:hypothetical protein
MFGNRKSIRSTNGVACWKAGLSAPAAIILVCACGGELGPVAGADGGGSGGGSSSGGAGSSSSSSGASSSSSGGGSSSGSLDGSTAPDAGVPDADPCVSNGATVTHHSDGSCEQASAFGTCQGNILEVDCVCPNGQGICQCIENNQHVKMVSYDCSSCEAVGSSWTACGFPPL